MKFLKFAAAAGLLLQTAGAAHAAQTRSHHADVLTARLRLIESPPEIVANR
jgi:hypothetical protein